MKILGLEGPSCFARMRRSVSFIALRKRRSRNSIPTSESISRVLTTQIKESLTRDRLMAALAGAFGFLAGLLAVLGLYGVIAYMVARRRNEIGVRIALGASRRQVIGLVMREAVLLAGNRAHSRHGTRRMGGSGGGVSGLWTETARSGNAVRGDRTAGSGCVTCELWTGLESVAPSTNGRLAGRIRVVLGFCRVL